MGNILLRPERNSRALAYSDGLTTKWEAEGEKSVAGEYERELEVAIGAAKEAAATVLDFYERAGAKEYTKSDGSPVTDADLASDKIIRRWLAEHFSDDGILTEEGADDHARLAKSRVWIVDPVDGTQQFVERTGEFDVLIALTVDGSPKVGVLLQPTTGLMLAGAVGSGAWIGQGDERKPLRFKPVPENVGPRIVTSKWFGAPESLPILDRVAERLGSPKPVVTRVGIYVRNFVDPVLEGEVLIGMEMKAGQGLGSEWDVAAADIVVNEAGGCFTNLGGGRFSYNKQHVRNRGGFVLSPDAVTHQRVLAALKPELNEINNPS